MPRKRHGCVPGEMCFSCPLPDCTFSGDLQKAETAMRKPHKDGIREVNNNGNHSPVKILSNREFLNRGVTTTMVNKTVLEEMLARQYGSKLAPRAK